jgi:hypothetical protein
MKQDIREVERSGPLVSRQSTRSQGVLRMIAVDTYLYGDGSDDNGRSKDDNGGQESYANDQAPLTEHKSKTSPSWGEHDGRTLRSWTTMFAASPWRLPQNQRPDIPIPDHAWFGD